MWSTINARYPIFKKVIASRLDDFSDPWLEVFEKEINTCFEQNAEAIERAADAYCRFSMEAMRLQAKFDVTLGYDRISYDEAVNEVYSNTEYMIDTYLPALLLSHYLWPHHYRQLQWAHDHFFAKLRETENVRFCDVGIGTGFYSKELLVAIKNARGWGFDISPASIAHTSQILTKWRVEDRYQLNRKEVERRETDGFNAFMSVELLEHLEDPQLLLNQLRAAVDDDALGFITAAIDAPNRDHIYLYRNNDSVAEHLVRAGFEILHSGNFAAYEKSSPQETVPQSGCFIVRALR
ncbi:MAG: methyltransferase [Rhodospirillales bacterium]|nr:methyltransferase [Rhodospirillales bacterium]